MGGLALKFKTWWDSADRMQKVVTVGGGAFLLLLLAGTFMFASRPKMSLAFAGLAPADTGSVAMEIEGMGIPVTYDGAGNVMVPSDKVAQVKAMLAMNGKLPKSNSHPGYEGLGSLGMMNTPRVERERLKTMVEGEVARSIEFFDGVDTARVHISLGEDSPFESEKRSAQASVTISEKGGSTVTSEQGRAMALLVASAVPGLEQNKVSIFSREGRSIWDGQELGATPGQANTKLEMEKAEARAKRDELQQSLNRMVGPGNAIAMVTLSLDLDQVDQTETRREPNPQPVSEQKTLETMSGGSAGVGTMGGGTSGLASNTGGAATPPTGAVPGGGYTMTQQSKQRTENVIVRNVKQGVGDIRSMGVTILVNSSVKDLTAVQNLANAFLGPKATDTQNFSAKVVAYEFDTKQQDEATKAEAAAASASRMQQIFSMLPIAALVFVAFLVMRQVGKLGKHLKPVMVAATPGGQALPMGPLSLPTESALTGMMAIPESVRQKAMEVGIDQAALARAMEVSQQEEIDIPDIGNKVNVPLEQIKKMSHDRPEVVAMLIKSWLLEDGIRR